MPRTLVISDLHLGSRGRISVADRPAVLERLLRAVAASERLVLLGDTVELLEGRPARAMAAAEPLLARVREALGDDGEVVVVPGNHDRPLVRRWVRNRGPALRREEHVPLDASPLLERLVSALGGRRAAVRVRYPGVWLREDVWATHGHYLDRHLLPVSPYGVVRGGRRRAPDAARAVPYDYDRLRRSHESSSTLEAVVERLRGTVIPRLTASILHPRVAPLTARALDLQMRHHAVAALLRVAADLGVEAEYVLFGHVHRLGPLDGEARDDWSGAAGRPRLVNTGAWLYEPRLVAHQRPPHPYWPGGAVVLEESGPPRAVNLLQDLSDADLRRPRARGRRARGSRRSTPGR